MCTYLHECLILLIFKKISIDPTDCRKLVELLIQQVEGAFACAFKSRLFPGEIVCTRRGSPLLVGIKTANDDLATDSIPIQYR